MQTARYTAMVVPQWRPTAIEGVLLRHLDAHEDERGLFREAWRVSWPDGGWGPFVQANVSRSVAGVLRGLHFHLRQADLWIILRGRAHVAAVDLRAMLDGSADRPASLAFELAEGDCALIPSRVAHGFLSLEDVDLLYMVTNEYDATDEHGFRWDDPLAAVDWPDARPRLSPRDEAAPSLADALRTLGQR